VLVRALAAAAIALAILIAWGLGAAQRPAPARQAGTLGVLGLATPLPGAIDGRAAAPRRISIPAIGVSAPVVALGLHHDGTLQTPRRWAATGWYKPGPEPGERGPAVIVGHVDSKTGPAVFYRLRELAPGDLIRIRRADAEHSLIRFRVQRVERWPKAEFPARRVYGPTRGAALRLVTCSGSFDRATGHYADNTIVYAARV
jgi:hypothetical protein